MNPATHWRILASNPALRFRNWLMIFLRGFEPTLDRILRILDGFKFGFAVRHAAGKFGYCRKKASAVFSGKRLDDYSIF
jgi:hypothetical protein